MNLHDGRRLRAVEGPLPADLADLEVPARVPGSTHLDLMAADLIPDPYADRNEAELTWMHRVDWQYSTTFRAQAARAGERVELVFDGIDTVATVELNGEVLGHTANMHRGYRFDVTGSLAVCRGSNRAVDAGVLSGTRAGGHYQERYPQEGGEGGRQGGATRRGGEHAVHRSGRSLVGRILRYPVGCRPTVFDLEYP